MKRLIEAQRADALFAIAQLNRQPRRDRTPLAMKALQAAADIGHSIAQLDLALALLAGEGMVKDPQRAVQLLRKLAETDYAAG